MTPAWFRPRSWTSLLRTGTSWVILAAIIPGKSPSSSSFTVVSHCFLRRHVYSVLDKFLKQNFEWTRQVGDWEICRTMSVRIIAVKDNSEARDLSKCVVGPVGNLTKGIIYGSLPIPRWGKRHGHSQKYIDSLVDCIAGFDGARDVGLDAHDDAAWESSGGPDQNRPPVGAFSSDMTGFLSGNVYIGQYEEDSSSSSDDESCSPSEPSTPEDTSWSQPGPSFHER